jgi:hypothetical protein
VAAEVRGLIEAANTTFVPKPVVQLVERMAEFVELASAELAELKDRSQAAEEEIAALRAEA